MTDLPTILVIDDEIRSLESLQRILCDDFDVKTASTVKDANAILEQEWVQLVLCDQRMPEQTGVEFLKAMRTRWPDIIRMIVSGYTDAHDIIDGINEAGIFQYITKPWHPENLILTLKNACRLYELQRQNELLAIELKMSPSGADKVVAERRETLRKDYDFDDGIIRGTDSSMNEVCATLRQVAPYDVPVLLSGASGTGKELAARALHYGSLRWNKPFVVENCGALPDQLLESELFGHKRGAFTGAVEDHVGLFERANGGSVFLDEIGEVSPAFQVKLLRVLQEGEIRPVGSAKTRKVDVRVIAATNRDLEDEVKAGRFRADLYYRLAGMVIRLPDLKDRRGDIPVLAKALLSRAMAHLGKQVEGFSEETLDCMQSYHWPGNVRELQNEIQQMLVMGKEGGLLGADLLSRHILRADHTVDEDGADLFDGLEGTLKDQIGQLECRIIRESLIRNRWNKSKAARELGLSRVGLRSKLERYELEKVKPLPSMRRAAG
ncbi:sigma-54-dependent Fis family transcriptional regulator [Stappia sp. BW2]|jgi:two-component system response regulator HupR/HoxA|uniref:sigma-54-dependent transcriptional regulator n=1 Tax=Stappia sp. BW2 TaxID=2592622 RepID=UPI0011DEA60E|nr:sigma-54 dependent transcriptional regulator [Stappia sp. BW2]TYC63138.1 sigma-54-dependent Fis family transcriptional regulator [Stappia sp. BW2]